MTVVGSVDLSVAWERSPRSAVTSSQSRSVVEVGSVMESGDGEGGNGACLFTFHIFIYRHFLFYSSKGDSAEVGSN